MSHKPYPSHLPLNVLLLGASRVGKTTLFYSVRDMFHDDYGVTRIKQSSVKPSQVSKQQTFSFHSLVDQVALEIRVADLHGEKEYQDALLPSAIQACDAFILLYDDSSMSSLLAIKRLAELIRIYKDRDHISELPLFLLGNSFEIDPVQYLSLSDNDEEDNEEEQEPKDHHLFSASKQQWMDVVVTDQDSENPVEPGLGAELAAHLHADFTSFNVKQASPDITNDVLRHLARRFLALKAQEHKMSRYSQLSPLARSMY